MKKSYIILLVILFTATIFTLRNNIELIKAFCLISVSTSLSLLIFEDRGEILKRDLYLRLQSAHEIGSTGYEIEYHRNLKKILSETPEYLTHFFWEKNPPVILLTVLWLDKNDTERRTKVVVKKNDPQFIGFQSV